MTAALPRVMGCVVAVAMLGQQSPAVVTAGDRQSPKIVSPTFGSQVDAIALPMTRAGNVWTARSAPLAPDIYSYKFSIDGDIVNDPANDAVIEEFHLISSKVAVPGALWTNAGAPAGAVTRHKYTSPVAGGDVEYVVYTPPGYDASRRERYPVVYLLHGLGDTAASWVTNGGADLTLNNLIAQHRLKPIVVVMPQCHPPGRMGLVPAAFEKSFFDELIPRIEGEYDVSRAAATRALAGVSVGGAQAMSIGMRRTDMFTAIGLFSVSFGTMSSTPGLPDPRQLPLDLSALREVFLGFGTEEHGFADPSRTFAESLRSRHIRVVTVEVKGQGHVWPVWRQAFADFLQTLFP